MSGRATVSKDDRGVLRGCTAGVYCGERTYAKPKGSEALTDVNDGSRQRRTAAAEEIKDDPRERRANSRQKEKKMTEKTRPVNRLATDRLSQLIAAELARHNLTGEEVARDARLPANAFRSLLRKGHRPTIDRADELCRALGITMTIGGPPRRDTPDPVSKDTDGEAAANVEPPSPNAVSALAGAATVARRAPRPVGPERARR